MVLARSSAIVVLLSLAGGPAVGIGCGLFCDLGRHHGGHAAAVAPDAGVGHGQHAHGHEVVPPTPRVDGHHVCDHAPADVVALVRSAEHLTGIDGPTLVPSVGLATFAAGAAAGGRTLLASVGPSPPASLSAVRITVLRL